VSDHHKLEPVGLLPLLQYYKAFKANWAIFTSRISQSDRHWLQFNS